MAINTEIQTLLEMCLKQEEECQFETLSRKDIWVLGNILVDKIQDMPKPVAAEIRINGLTLFSYYPEGTSAYYKMVLDKKHATANFMEKSSLRFFAENQISGLDPEKDMFLDPTKFQFRGGGFPIRLKNGCVIGTIAAAGMAHTEDHALIVDAIRLFMQKQTTIA